MNVVFFEAGDNLWVTNGTAAGTSELSVAAAYSEGLLGYSELSIVVAIDPSFAQLGDRVLFDGNGANNHEGLWATNGTAAGTSELSVANGSSEGLDPIGLAVFGSEVLFSGRDTNNDFNLWVTNGTGAGTSELSVVEANSEGLFTGGSPNLTVLGSEVVFEGRDSNSQFGLWVTNGTGSGTSEISVAGAYSEGNQGLEPTDFTVLGSEVLFVGKAEAVGGDDNLFVTNGTASGTSELLPTDGNADYGLQPNDLTVFGSEILFEGFDNSAGANSDWGLFVTNGTTSGTSELSIGGAYSGGIFGPGDVSPDFTVFGSEVLFQGRDANGDLDLWVTNGVAISELTSSDLQPEYITVLGSEALFYGYTAGAGNLWVTNGTVSGTSELSVAGAYSEGLDPVSLTLFGSEVLFDGRDASDRTSLWVTDGTSSGTSELSSEALQPADFAVYSQTPPPLENVIFFAGYDSAGQENLWISNGTAAGTSELSVVGAGQDGLFYGAAPDFTRFGSEVLFDGSVVNSGLPGLWVINETGGISELSVEGLGSPEDFTVFGSEVLFGGIRNLQRRFLGDERHGFRNLRGFCCGGEQ